MYPDYLMHHGVKGMKWGVRKTQRKIAKLNKRSRQYGYDIKRYNDIKSRGNKTAIDSMKRSLDKQRNKASKTVSKILDKMPDGYGVTQIQVEDLNLGINYVDLMLQRR